MCGAIVKAKVTFRAYLIKTFFFFVFFFILQDADPFATKLSLMVHYHKQECLMKRVLCCVQGHGHSNGYINFTECLSGRYLLNHIG